MAKTSLRPLADKVVVERIEAADKTAGGIILPDNAKEKPQRGTVVAVGPGPLTDDGRRAEMQLAVGNEVVFKSYSGTEMSVNDKDYVVMTESDVLAVVE